MVNPQYHLRVHNTGTSASTSIDKRNKTQVILTAQATRDISLNVTAVWSQGERISELSQKEVVAHSGPYTYGHARVAAHLARMLTLCFVVKGCGSLKFVSRSW
jgi:calpain-7